MHRDTSVQLAASVSRLCVVVRCQNKWEAEEDLES